MRLVVNAAALNEGLQIASRAMSTRTANPILEGILLEARMGQLRITASDERLTILTRVFAILQKTPVTVFLLSGIFPLVPGAGIYYTAYYFIQGDNALALSNGISTFKVAVALAVGISLVLSIPLPPRHRSG